MVGNFDVDVQHQQRVGHLFGPLPPEMRNDTAFMDRIHAYLPGWDVPKVSRDLLTDHFGLVSDFLSECWNQLRRQSRQNRSPGAHSLRRRPERTRHDGRQEDRQRAAQAAVAEPGRLRFPTRTWSGRCGSRWSAAAGSRNSRSASAPPSSATPSSATRWARTAWRSSWPRPSSTARTASAATRCRRDRSGSSPGGGDENPGLYQIDVTEGPGSGVKILNQPAPPPFKESVRCAEQNLYARAKELVGDRDPRQHEFSVQLRAFDSAKSGSAVGVGVLLALCSSLLQKSIKGGLAVTGGLNLGGSIETIFNPVAVVEIAIEKGAASILMPISSRRQLNDLPDDLAAKITIHYYLDARDALLKALAI